VFSKNTAIVAVLAILISAVGFAPRLALAHAEPSAVTPGDGAVLTTAPAQVTMDTDEEMVPEQSSLNVFNAANTQVNTATSVVDANQTHISVALPASLPVGVYTVKWATVSADDGDAANGSWTFTYDPSKPASPGSSVPGATAPSPTATTTAVPTTPAATTTPPASTPVASATATVPAATTSPAVPKVGTGVATGGGVHNAALYGLVLLLVAGCLTGTGLIAARRR